MEKLDGKLASCQKLNTEIVNVSIRCMVGRLICVGLVRDNRWMLLIAAIHNFESALRCTVGAHANTLERHH